MRKFLGIFIILFSIAAFFSGHLFLNETMVAVSNPSEYHFGSESMIAEGGDHYRSLPAYVEHGHYFATTLFFISVCCSLIGTWIITKRK